MPKVVDSGVISGVLDNTLDCGENRWTLIKLFDSERLRVRAACIDSSDGGFK